MYLFSIDGEADTREKELISNFLRFSQADDDEEDFEALLAMKIPNRRQVIDYLKEFKRNKTAFFILLQLFSLLRIKGQSKKTLSSCKSLLNLIQLDEEEKTILEEFFVRPNPENENILWIGNHPEKDDICKSKKKHWACIIEHQDLFYFVSAQNPGMIRINQRYYFDHQVIRLELRDRIFIAGEPLSFSDIFFRFDLKRRAEEVYFSMVRHEKHEEAFTLKQGHLENALGHLHVRGCHISIHKRQQDIPIYIEDEEERLKGSVDEKVIVNKRFVFDLSRDIKSISFTSEVHSRIEEKEQFVLGQKNGADLYLRLPRQGSCFITLTRSGESLWEIDNSQAQEMPIFIEGRPLHSLHRKQVRNGQIIKLGPRQILFSPLTGTVRRLNHSLEKVEVRNLKHTFPDGKVGLQDISFTNFSQDFTCIMGPSGCGKTTLAKVLSAHIDSEYSQYAINDHSVLTYRDHLRGHIGYVPQEDQLFENLTVFENLYYYSQLRNPKISRKEQSKRIEQVLLETGLNEKRDLKVGSAEEKILSGGEKRRLNIALELLSDCDLLILDEPTSGLSSFDAQRIISFLHHLSRQGKILYLVIHQPSQEIYRHFTHLLLLDRGGYQAYFGKADMALQYFSKYTFDDRDKLNGPDEIMNILESVRRTPEGELIYETGEKNQKIPMRLKSPRQWYQEYIIRKNDFPYYNKGKPGQKSSVPEQSSRNLRDNLKQFLTLTFRTGLNKVRDKSYMLLSFMLPLISSAILSFLLRYKTPGGEYSLAENRHLPKFLFLSVIIFLFFAAVNGIAEIYRERAVYHREKLCRLPIWALLFSKWLVISLITSVQLILYILVAFLILQIPIIIISDNAIFLRLFLQYSLLGIIATASFSALTLWISAWLRSERAAFLAVPILIIPQILLGGMFLSFRDTGHLNIGISERAVPYVADVIHARWFYETSLNIFRYQNPDKDPRFINDHDYVSGKYNNLAIGDVFRTYYLSESEDSDQKEREDEQQIQRMIAFGDYVERIEEDELSFSEHLKEWHEIPLHPFPYPKKVAYPFIINTVTFNHFALIFLCLVSLFGAYIKIKKLNE